MPIEPRVLVVQDGARLHYALPLALQRLGMLERAFTPWYTPPGSLGGLLAKLVGRVKPALGRRMAQRHHPDLDPRLVASNRRLLMRQRWLRRGATSLEDYYERLAEMERDWILGAGWGRANLLAGFVRNVHHDLCRRARDAGLRVVADQMIAPAAVEAAEAREQQKRWPGWEKPVDLGRVADFEAATWASCDRVTCASDYVRDGLVAECVAADRIVVNPYPVAAPEFRFADRSGRSRPTIGFIGQVGLRKGAPYFFEVAERLRDRARFVAVGPVAVAPAMVAKFGSAVEIVGPVPRSDVPGWLERFDIYLFPSTCEGSAGSVAEAMLTGLPIVASPNSGSVVRDEIDGFIMPYDDVSGMADRVGRLIDDEESRLAMGQAARDRVARFDLDAYGARLGDIIRQCLA